MLCMTCRYYEHEDGHDEDKGNCHRYPPKVTFDPNTAEVLIVWPMVDLIDWCGEHEDRGDA